MEYTNSHYEKLADSRRKSIDQLIIDCEKVHGDTYDYSKVVYVNCMTKCEIVCKKHGSFKQTMNQHLRGYGCPKCKTEKTVGIINKKRHEDNVQNFVSKCQKVHGDSYEYLEQYESCYQKILIRCKTCGHEFRQAASNHLFGQGCPSCSRSKGEKSIELWLKTNGICHKPEHWFDDCRGICRPLPFDFWLPEHNILIEYQGRQHFECVYFSKDEKYKESSEKNFQQTKINDSIKKRYCVDKGIRLIEITHKQLRSIDKILSSKIDK